MDKDRLISVQFPHFKVTSYIEKVKRFRPHKKTIKLLKHLSDIVCWFFYYIYIYFLVSAIQQINSRKEITLFYERRD